MKVRPDQLSQQLQKQLSPVYLISGDEPLQAMEAADSIRSKARALGYSERTVLDVDKDFDWDSFLAESNSLSLFAEQRILELRIPSGKPGKAGSQALVTYTERPAEDTVLIISAGKLDKTASNSKWFKAIDALGVTVQCWPVDNYALPGWIETRMKQQGMHPTKEAIRLLVERVEGNLLAAAQEVDKLRLLVTADQVDEQAVTEAVADNSRFNIFDLGDAALSGDIARTSHIVHGLQAEGVEVVLALWSLTKEIRSLQAAAESGAQSADAALAKAGVWAKRIPLMKKALQRHNRRSLRQLLANCAYVDRVIKGLEKGKAWDELTKLCLALAGYQLTAVSS